jgi:hypothetical protein
LEFGESLANFFFADSLNLGLFRVCFLAIVQSRQKSPPVSFLFQRTGLGAQRSLGIDVQKVSKFIGIEL